MSRFLKRSSVTMSSGPAPIAAESTPQTTNPLTTSKIKLFPKEGTVHAKRNYTQEEQSSIDALREYARSLSLPPDDPYYPNEQRWLADLACAERYMRAAKWKLDDAKKRIQTTLEWRREYKPDLISPTEVRIESETGKIVLNGFDVDGRPIITINPGRENTDPSERQIKHLIFILERAIDLMPAPVDSLVILVNYKETTMRNNTSISTARRVIHVLQSHYPERLGRAIVVNLPLILEVFFRGISPFLDPITRDKLRFNPDLKELIPEDHLDVQFGGSFHYEFEPTSYWGDLLAHCRINPEGTRQGEPATRPLGSAAPAGHSSAVADPTTTDGHGHKPTKSESSTSYGSGPGTPPLTFSLDSTAPSSTTAVNLVHPPPGIQSTVDGSKSGTRGLTSSEPVVVEGTTSAAP